MKVLYVVTAYNRHPDDVITPWLVETIDRLRARGVDVEVLAPAYRGSSDGDVAGVRVHRFRYAPRGWEDLTHEQTAPDRVRERPAYLGLVPSYVASGMWRAWRLARRDGFDLVHVHWPVPHALMGMAARRAAGIPLVCTFHGVELTWTRNRFPALMPFVRHVIRTADAVTANSTYTAQLVRRVYERRVVRIPFGATVQPPADRSVGANGADGASFEVMFAGRLVERKGVRYLLDAVARLRDAHHPIRLEVVGDGPERTALEAHAVAAGVADRVTFHGFVSSDELARRFTACDAFVLPAVVDAKGDVEGLGVVLIEALSHGTPVIASAAGGIVDIVRDGETGLLVPPGDADALAGAIERYIERPERAAALAAAGRAHVEREFSWPVVIDGLVDLYEELAGGPRRRRTANRC